MRAFGLFTHDTRVDADTALIYMHALIYRIHDDI